jgi:hypothetical protein
LEDRFKFYLEKDHCNDTIYRCNEQNIDEKTTVLVYDAIKLKELYRTYESITDTEDYRLFIRMFNGQTKLVYDKVAIKDNSEILSTCLQKPTNPDATY